MIKGNIMDRTLFLILASGKGSRLKTQTPKPLLKACGKSLIDYRKFNYELVGENLAKKFIYSPYYGKDKSNQIFDRELQCHFQIQSTGNGRDQQFRVIL